MLTTSTLAAGGLVAAVVAGWHQVKSAASYLTSFVVVNAKLDEALSIPVQQHIRTKYKLVPSGMLHFIGRYMLLKGRNNTVIVPFRITANSVIYVKGWQVLFVSLEGSGMSIRSLRGLVNFEKLISTALDDFEDRMSNKRKDDKASRFQVIRVIGQEKTGFGGSEVRRRYSNDSESPSEALGGGNSSNFHFDPSIDKPFKYSRTDYVTDGVTDPFEGLYFEDHVMRYIHQAQQWKDMGEWYVKRGIPWRRGWLLHGPGGTGKSSLAKAVAQLLGIPIYQYYLNTLSDQEFIREWESMTTPCIALCEDFDAVFNLRESLTEHRSLTFDCVLNQISGVGSTNGVFLMVSTNRLDHIDPAMGVACGKDGVSTRPGRIDTVIEVSHISRANRYRMAQKILCDWPEEIERIVNKVDEVTPVQFQEMCIQLAYDKLSEPHLKLVEHA